MGQAIGQVLPLAVGVAISPVPIIAVVLMLVTPRARVNGPAFVAGWLLGLGVVGAIVLLVASSVEATNDGEPATWVNVLELVFGALLVLASLKQWRGRPRSDQEPATPKWMGAIEGFGPGKALVAAAVVAAVNPKNLPLAVAAAASIAGTGISGGEQAVAYVVFALVGAVGVAAPVVIYFAMGEKAGPLLDRLRQWMARNNAVIMAVLLLVIGANLIGDGIAGLSS